MWKRLVATVLAFSLPAGVSAGPLKEAAEREARKLSSAQRDDARSRARLWTGIALICGGAVLASLGAGELGGEDEGPNDPAEPTDGGETGDKAMLAGGIAAGALGVVLLLTGASRLDRSSRSAWRRRRPARGPLLMIEDR